MMKLNELISNIEMQAEEKVIVHTGDEVLTTMRIYAKEQSKFLESVIRDYPEVDLSRRPSREVIGFYDLIYDKHICMKISSGKDIDYSEIVFSTRFLPFRPDVWISGGEPDLKEIYEKEIDLATRNNSGKEVLIITGHCYAQTYVACNITEKSLCLVENYKTYKEDFTVTDFFSDKSHINNGEYAIYVPTKEFTVLTGLDIPYSRISCRMQDEPWEKRPFYIPGKYIIECFDKYALDKETFIAAVHALNQSYRKDLKYPQSYRKLEKRVLTFDKLAELSAPFIVIEKELNLIKNALRELNIL